MFEIHELIVKLTQCTVCFRCSGCFDCPCCGNTLSTRATSVPVTGTDQAEAPKTATKKVFYLACGFCRWSSRDVGIPDQVTGQYQSGSVHVTIRDLNYVVFSTVKIAAYFVD